MKRRFILFVSLLVLGMLITSCDLLISSSGGEDLESTRVALAVQQTSMVMDQTRMAQAEPVVVVTEPPDQPTFTPYPTYTQPVIIEPPPVEPTTFVVEQPAATEQSFSRKPLRALTIG